MLFHIAANAVLLLHLAFILFALLGATLAVRWRRLPFLHLPAAVWGIYVELGGQICPLTYLENYFRRRAGLAGYNESFIEHYLLNLIYPSGLTQEVQFILAGFVLGCNIAIYGWLLLRRRNRSRRA